VFEARRAVCADAAAGGAVKGVLQRLRVDVLDHETDAFVVEHAAVQVDSPCEILTRSGGISNRGEQLKGVATLAQQLMAPAVNIAAECVVPPFNTSDTLTIVVNLARAVHLHRQRHGRLVHGCIERRTAEGVLHGAVDRQDRGATRRLQLQPTTRKNRSTAT
jgi:hypothetical protein